VTQRISTVGMTHAISTDQTVKIQSACIT